MIECESLSKRVKAYRFKNNMTQAALAKVAGVLQSQVSMVESKAIASHDTIAKLRAVVR